MNKLKHISFIMDGNGRWAKEKGMPRNAGHKAGVDKAKEIILTIKELGIPYISLYTFSKENWKRPENEVSFLMNLIIQHLEKEFDFYIKNKIKILHIGDRQGVSPKVLAAIDKVVDETKHFTDTAVMLAFNYSGKYDIIQACNKLVKTNKESCNVTEEDFSKLLLTSNYPDPDLIIRTSGEFRISNYFLWQAAYSEFYITDKYWPDLTKEDVVDIINNFNNRERRFGGIKKK